ncbi:MAG: SDR family NAD(P)-dependent oxidoreductase [Zetaproteobacteria bacterium]|nr:SDR family NAD(P)-dependent oxidoreductase [Zetaproteobacteria bacterium]
MANDLKGKIFLVTGASSGLGRAIATLLGKAEANVIAIARGEEGLAVTQERVEQAGGRCLCIPFNLLKMDDYGKLFLALKDQVPHLDGIVHCAGFLTRCAPMQYVKPKKFQEMIDIHLTAPNLLTQMMFPLLKRSPAASVIFTSCDMATENQSNWHGYGLAKRALPYVAAMWQDEHPDKAMRFNTINPGRMRTPMFERAYPGLAPDTVPVAMEIAPAFIYMLSETANAYRGQHLQAAELLTQFQAETFK